MGETVDSSNKSERRRLIEKHILSFIFRNYEFIEDEYTNKIHWKVSDDLRKEFGSFISNDEIDTVLFELINQKYIAKSKENELTLYPNGLNYSLENHFISNMIL